jgi:hypothetical protein
MAGALIPRRYIMIDWQRVLKDLDDMHDYFMKCAESAAPGSKARETFTGYMVTLNTLWTKVSNEMLTGEDDGK